MIPIKTYGIRRRHLASQMHKGVAIIPTSPERVRSRDGYYPYRFDSYFYYLTGFSEPEAVLVIIAGNDEGATKDILFCQDKDIEREIWNGFRHGPESTREAFRLDETYPIS
ncbi:MAG: aminopeptidase P N-terminal domain-containing protein, partial [Nitrosomonadaceae bacterium]